MAALNLCFVCLGNICRSPTAEGVMLALVRDAGLTRHIVIDSAGTGAWHAGEPADARARAAAKDRGIELTGRARLFVRADLDRFDYVLAMDLANLRVLRQMARSPEELARIHLFRSFDPAAPADAEVPDPYYGGPQGFDEVLDICERGCRGLLAHLRDALAQALGARVTAMRPLAGGDINQAHAVTLDDHREVFVKTHPDADPRLFPCEARGLQWLAEADALPVPRVLAVSAETAPGPHFLVLEMLRPGPRRRDHDPLLGRGLAALHLTSAPGFGLDHDNFIGSLPQDNTAHATWSDFYAQRRLLPQVRRAVDSGRAPPDWALSFDRLAEKLPALVGPAEPPARLHGDLWGGNLHTSADGSPVLIDPAVYGGHREVDLAMLALFGGASERMLDAYDEAHPLAPGWSERVPLYQLYPLLVHVNLFGMSYGGQVERTLRRYA